MDALKISTSPKERRKYDTKCKGLLIIAERIKKLKDSQRRHALEPTNSGSSSRSSSTSNLSRRAGEPISKRNLSNREQIILLENSKLNGAVFPPWSALPEPEEFEQHEEGELFR